MMACNAVTEVKHNIVSMLQRSSLQVHMYNMYGTQLPQHFSMGSEVQRDGIQECHLYSDGLVVLTKALQLWAVSGLQEPRPQKLASPRLKEAPHCMAIFEPRHTLSGCLEVSTNSLLLALMLKALSHNIMTAGLAYLAYLAYPEMFSFKVCIRSRSLCSCFSQAVPSTKGVPVDCQVRLKSGLKTTLVCCNLQAAGQAFRQSQLH